MGSDGLLKLMLLFGVWLASVASIVCGSVSRETGSRRTPESRRLVRRSVRSSVLLVASYLTVAMTALVLTREPYPVIVAAFGASIAIQSVQFWIGLVRARRLRLVAASGD